MDFDFKITSWERVSVDEKDEEQLLRLIKEGEITCANDVFNYDFDVDCSKLAEADEQMTLEENGGSATIEVIGNNGDTIFSNEVEK